MAEQPTIADMRHAIASLGVVARAIEHADKLSAGLENAEQVGRELDAAIASKRAELASETGDLIAAAKADAEKAGAQIVADARDEAAKLIADARRVVTSIEVETAEAQKKLDTTVAALESAKHAVRAVAAV
jgi:hypothetical protein